MHCATMIFKKFITIFIFFVIIVNNAFCDLERTYLFNNIKYQNEYSKNERVLYGAISDIAGYKMSNDPADAIADELKELPTIFVTDCIYNRVTWNIIDPTDSSATFKSTDAIFNKPMGIASNGQGKIIIADTFHDRLVEYTIGVGSDGIMLTNEHIIGEFGPGQGQFDKPHGVCYDKNGKIWVADTENRRIQILNPDGSYFGEVNRDSSDVNFNFRYISDVAVSYTDPDIYYVCDYGRNRISKFSVNTGFICSTQGSLSDDYYKIDLNKDDTVYATVKNADADDRILVLNANLTQIIDEMKLDKTTFSRAVCSFTQKVNGNWVSKNKVAVAGNDKIEIFGFGTSIKKNLCLLNPMWVNPVNNEYHPDGLGVIQVEITNPGGTVTINDYSNLPGQNNLQKNIYSGTTSGENFVFNYTPFKTNGSIVDAGLHALITQVLVPGQLSDVSVAYDRFFISYDSTPPTLSPIFVEENSTLLNGVLNASSQTIFWYNGGEDLDNNGAEGSGINYYEYRVGNGSFWSEWKPVAKNYYRFSLPESYYQYSDFNGLLTLQYRATDNVGNIGDVFTFDKPIKIGFSVVSGEWGSYAKKINDNDIRMSGSKQYYNGNKWENVLGLGKMPDKFDYFNSISGFGTSQESTGRKLYRWNGRAWKTLAATGTVPSGVVFNDIIAINQQSAYIAASNGTVYRLTVTDEAAGTAIITYSGDGVFPGDVKRLFKTEDGGTYWVTGINGLIAYKTGTDNWVTEASAVNAAINDIHVFSDGTGWAVGDNGLILRRQDSGSGFEWAAVQSEPAAVNNLNAIHMKDKNLGWIAGNQGRVLIWDGSIWHAMSVQGVTGNLTFITAGKDTVWAGGSGVLIKNFETQYVPVSRPIGLSGESDPGTVTLTWQASQNGNRDTVQGYNLYWGEYANVLDLNSAGFSGVIDAGQSNTYTMALNPDKKYIFAVTARYDGESAGETYLSNEVIINGGGSLFKSAGTDAYPVWHPVHGVHVTNDGSAYATDSKERFFKYDGAVWKTVPVPMPDFSDVTLQGAAMLGEGKAMAFGYGSGNTTVMEYINGAWVKVNYLGRCISPGFTVCNENIIGIIPLNNGWLCGSVGNQTEKNSGLLAKYLGAGSWYNYTTAETELLEGFRFAADESFGYGSGNIIFENGSFGKIPFAIDNFDFNLLGFAGDNTGSFSQLSVPVFTDRQNGWTGVVCRWVDNNGSFGIYGIMKWDGIKWSVSYLSSEVYEVSDGVPFSNMTIRANEAEGLAWLKVNGNTVMLRLKNNSWKRINAPAELSFGGTESMPGGRPGLSSYYGQFYHMRDITDPNIPVPMNLNLASNEVNKGITVSWTAPSGAANIKGYNLYRKYEGEPYFPVANSIQSVSFEDNRFMLYNGAYKYKVTASDIYGNESDYSAEAEITVNYLLTPVATPTPEITNTPTPTPTPTPQTPELSWSQPDGNLSHTNYSPYMGYGHNVNENFDVKYGIYAPDTIENVVVDENNNLYMYSDGSVSKYIIKVSPEGVIDYVNTFIDSQGMALGRYQGETRIYYSEFNPDTGFAGIRARRASDGAEMWSAPGYWHRGRIGIDGQNNIYLPNTGGVSKFRDDGSTYTNLWYPKIIGNPVCTSNSGTGFAADSDNNIYIPEPAYNNGYCGISGLRIAKYSESGDLLGTGVIGTDYNHYYTTITVNNNSNPKTLFIKTINVNTNEIVYVVADSSINIIKTIPTGIIAADFFKSGKNGSLIGDKFAFNKRVNNTAKITTYYQGKQLYLFDPISPVTTNFVYDSAGFLYAGNEYEFLIINPGNTQQSKRFFIEGEKSHIAIGKNSDVYFNNNTQLICFGRGAVIPTPVSTPVPPANVSGFIPVDASSVTLVWDAQSGNVTGYNLYISGSPYELLNTQGPVTTTEYTVTGLVPGQAYSFIITTVDGYDQESAPSEEIFIVFGTPTFTSTATVTPTDTPTLSPTLTATETATHTATATPTVTVTSTPTATMAVTVKIKTDDQRELSNSPHPQVMLVSADTRTINLALVEIRYWYMFEGTNQAETAVMDYAGILPSGTNITSNTVTQVVNGSYGAGQDRYMKISFASGSLANGEYLILNTRFNKSDYSDYIQTNDHSFAAVSDYTVWEKVTVYYNGALIWGTEPDINTLPPSPTRTPTVVLTSTMSITPTFTGTLTASATGTDTATVTATITASVTATVTGTATASVTNTLTPSATLTATGTYTQTLTATLTTSPTQSPTVTPESTVSSDISLLFKAADTSSTTNSPKPNFRLYNNSSSQLALDRVKIRYWYTFEGSTQTEAVVIDYAGKQPSGANIQASTSAVIVQGSFSDQDRYLEVSFASGAGTIGQNEYAEIQTRFNKNDWSNYDQTDDWSYAGYTTFTEWNHVTVYLDGVKVLGLEPGQVQSSGLAYSPTRAEAISEKNVYNYPNPFSGETTIRFSLDKSQPVSLAVFDSKGAFVWAKKMEAAQVKPGVNRVVWDGSGLKGKKITNGIYILKITAGAVTVTKKIAYINDGKEQK